MLLFTYRCLLGFILKPAFFFFAFPPSRRQHSILNISAPPPCGSHRIWFHAASVGELESLWPLVGLAGNNGSEIILSIFSESAWGSLNQLKTSLEKLNVRIIASGYSPWEGHWKKAFLGLEPHLFVTSKYEAWPDLWASLTELKIPLAIVSARPRKSLKLARRLCKLFVGKLPKLFLFPTTDDESLEFKTLFPQAQIFTAGDPRWDRVASRSHSNNPRVQNLIQTFSGLPRPWGILGSIWLEDLELFKNYFAHIPGSLWIVPHQPRPETVEKIEGFLKDHGIQFERTSHIKERETSRTLRAGAPGGSGGLTSSHSQPACVIVDEIGFLTELYSVANWSYVGGGFGAGVHSTIEPAIYGLPIAAGPARAERFSEIGQLSSTGQLTLVRQPADLEAWLDKEFAVEMAQETGGERQNLQRKERWIQEAKDRLGATQRIWSFIENRI